MSYKTPGAPPFVHQHAGPPWHPILCSLKVHRAQQHLGEVVQGIDAFRDSKPYELDPENADFPEGERPLARILRDPPEELGGPVGDCLQDFKSALDHAIHHLTRVHTGEGPRLERTEFPIFIDGMAYRQRRERLIGGLPVKAQALVDDVQPYANPAHPEPYFLYLLHELARIDRHRRLHIVCQAVVNPPTVTLTPQQVEVRIALHVSILQPGLGVLSLRRTLEGIEVAACRVLDKLATISYG